MILSFSASGFDALLALDGTLPELHFFLENSRLPIIAADGAALSLAKIGVSAQEAIGDFDSLPPENHDNLQLAGTKLIYDAGQDDNDFEKLLRHALNNGQHRFLLCGFQGGELEHTLNNWSVLMKFAANPNVNACFCIYDSGRYAIPVNQSLEVNLQTGEMVSLIPQPSARVTTRGLEWRLDNEELRLGRREGARNRVVSPNVGIELHQGSYLLCLDSRLPLAPAFETKNNIK